MIKEVVLSITSHKIWVEWIDYRTEMYHEFVFIGLETQLREAYDIISKNFVDKKDKLTNIKLIKEHLANTPTNKELYREYLKFTLPNSLVALIVGTLGKGRFLVIKNSKIKLVIRLGKHSLIYLR